MRMKELVIFTFFFNFMNADIHSVAMIFVVVVVVVVVVVLCLTFVGV